VRLGIDIDGCLANFNEAYTKALIATAGINHMPSGWEGNFDVYTSWNWDLDFGYTAAQISGTWDRCIVSSPTFWKKLDPLPLATETISRLNMLSKEGHDIYFMTHRMGEKAKRQTEQWLYEMGMDYPTVIMSGHKTPIVLSLGLNLFVDDKLDTIHDLYRVARAGNVDTTHFYLKNASWNQVGRIPGLRDVHSVKEGIEALGLWTPKKDED
jgi:hypothetical protein